MRNCYLKFSPRITAAMALIIICGCTQIRQPNLSASIASEGKTAACITLATDASAPEKTAAAELAAYLNKATGAEFAIVKPQDADGRPVIAVGPGAEAQIQ